MADLLSGLHYAHELRDYDGAPLGIVHRDVSPHNIFVTYDGAVKLLDFGIAKASINTDLTETGKLKGKTSYMAPEQAVGSGSTDRRADIFVAGIVLWELLTRERLFGGDAVSALWKLAAVDEIPRPSLLRPDVPPALDVIVARALDRDPAKRFATAQEMRAALEDYLRAAGEDVGSDEIGAKHAGGVRGAPGEHAAAGPRRTSSRARRAWTARARPPSLASRVSQFEGAEGRRIQPVIALDEELGQRTSGTPGPGRPASDSASLKSNLRTAAGPQQRSYWIGALGAAALVAAAAFSTRRPGGQAPAAGSAAAVLVEPDAGARCTGVLRVRITTGDTGTATDISPPYNYGVYDYLRHLNDSQGGLRGCPIDVDMKDAQYDPAKTEEVIEAWRQQPGWSEVSTLFVFGTGPTTRVAPRLTEEKKLIIPGSYAGSSPRRYRSRRTCPMPSSTRSARAPPRQSTRRALDTPTSSSRRRTTRPPSASASRPPGRSRPAHRDGARHHRQVSLLRRSARRGQSLRGGAARDAARRGSDRPADVLARR